ncbi:electron transfer flavoprotein-ubiquinone oxidoreductase [Trichophyton tonsurans CBS 112818]|uniref:Electron transfer flavoprotein-ubiquinone oxidoreductase n=1 Tax=Trichophyton tonsurans (strain CBS 112818) TaxID=647933 RepID=F2RUN4_TRIT1|nr:electron transfer flavoprotein-ubiquinone oxidoreductase [Trichophyton tonsurans CBS 112818]
MASRSAVLPLAFARREACCAAPAWKRATPNRAVAAAAGLSQYSTSAPVRRRAVQRCIAGQKTGLARFSGQQQRSFSHAPVRREEEQESRFRPEDIQRESDEVDVCIVGGGPAGLCAAIQLKKLANEAGNEDFRVLLLEKAAHGHQRAATGLAGKNNPNRFEHTTPVTTDKMRFLTEKYAIPIPAPPQMNNHGNYLLSLSQLCKWLGERAEELGVEVYPGFAASEVLYNADGSVKGVATNDVGIGRNGKPKESFERGMEFHARVTLLGEGCHGSLTKKVMKKFDLRRDCQPQTYGIGIKEVWEIQPEKFRKGEVTHTMGYPLPRDTYGGSFMYHFGDNMVSVGLTVGLDYPNPWLSPYNEFQKLKQHPLFRSVLEGGQCIAYAGRALIEGGFQSIPKCAFPGGALIGDSAGFMNVPKVKGTHTSMLSGMLAAKATYSALSGNSSDGTIFLYEYEDALRSSTIWSELKEVRNMRPSFNTPLGIYGGIMYSGLEAYILRGRVPWTLKHHSTDSAATKPASECKKIEYPKPDGEVTFDILTSVSRTGTNHEEDQPVHLQVADWEKHTADAWPKWQGVENRFCPAGVYEYIEDKDKPHGVRFQINAQNEAGVRRLAFYRSANSSSSYSSCIHCKTCDIKVPTQDINWQTPQGGEGPKYSIT